MSSVIIPAHNESSVIKDSLLSLQHENDENISVIVVSNGCSDNTAQVARCFGSRITSIETPIPSKTNAINLGEEYASSYPYIYMDADIQLTNGSLDKIVSVLSDGQYLAVSPTPKMDFTYSNWFVKAYYDVWLSLPYSRQGLMGAGVYALSEEGRKRFKTFPDIIADDGYVRALFKEHERSNVEGAHAIVKAPASLYWLIKIKTRSRMGQWQLAERFPELIDNEEKDYSKALSDVLRQPLLWPKVMVYIYVNFISRIMAKRKMKDLANYQWDKDVSSRQGSEN